MTTTIELSSPSNQQLAQNDLLKRLRPHCILTLEADRLPAQSHVGFVRAEFDTQSQLFGATRAPENKKIQNEPGGLPTPMPKPYNRANRIPQSNIFGFCVTRAARTPQALTSHDATDKPGSSDFASPEQPERCKPLRCKTLRTTKHPRFCVTRLNNPAVSRFCVTEKPSLRPTTLQPPRVP